MPEEIAGSATLEPAYCGIFGGMAGGISYL